MDKIKLDNPKIGLSLNDLIDISYDIVDNDYNGDRIEIKNILTNANWVINEKGIFPVWTFCIIPPPLVESSYQSLTDWLAFVETMVGLNNGKVLKFHPNKEKNYVYDTYIDVTVIPMEFTFMLKVNIYSYTKLVHSPNGEYIRLVSPKVNDIYGYGDYMDIVYVSENLTTENTITFSLYIDGSLFSTLGTSNHNDGHVQIPMPLIQESDNVTIKADVNGLPGVFSVSDKFSSSKPISIDIVNPDSAIEAIAGDTLPIQWILHGAREYMAIDLYMDSIYHSTIASNILSSNNAYQWIVLNNIESTNCYLKLIAYNVYNNPTGYGSFSISSKIFSILPEVQPPDPPIGDPVPDSTAYFEFNGNLNDLKGNYVCLDHQSKKVSLLGYSTEPNARQVLKVRDKPSEVYPQPTPGFRLNLPLGGEEWTIGVWMKRVLYMPNSGYSAIPWHMFSIKNDLWNGGRDIGFSGGYDTSYNNENGRHRAYSMLFVNTNGTNTDLAWLRDNWQYYIIKKIKLGMTWKLQWEVHWVGVNPEAFHYYETFTYNITGDDCYFSLWSSGFDQTRDLNSFQYKFLRFYPRAISDFERDQIITWEATK